MTEALITNLAKLSALSVISRTSVMRFKGSDRSLPAIAAELAADAIVEGSVIRSGNNIRITTQLIDAATDQHLWAESYDRNFEDAFVLQSEIAKTIAEKIQITVTPEESSRLAQAAERSTDGYDDYLKGMQRFYRLTPQDLETALQHFDISLEQNPSSALALSGVAAAWIGLQQMGFVPSSEASPRAEAAALSAMKLDGNLAEPYVWLAIIRAWSDWDWVTAEELFTRAIELNPSYADARGPYGHLLAVLGRFDEAFLQFDEALRLDPFNGWFRGQQGVTFHMAGQFDQAIASFEEALRISPDLPFVWLVLAASYHMSGKFDEAIQAEGSLLAALGDADGQRQLLKIYEESGYLAATEWLANLSAEQSATTGSLGYWAALRYAQGSYLYSAIKAAVTHYTKLAGVELGAHGIRVNAISPGAIATPIFWGGSARANSLSDEDNARKMEKLKANLARATPIPRAGLADDIAEAALFLASDAGSFVNCHDLVVDGGRTSMFPQ